VPEEDIRQPGLPSSDDVFFLSDRGQAQAQQEIEALACKLDEIAEIPGVTVCNSIYDFISLPDSS
jgi:hypothetical protein